MQDFDFRFCPNCATPLTMQFYAGAIRPVCPACGFVQFHDPKVAVVGLVEHEGRVLLVRRAAQPEQGKWALPGGYMDAGEMPEAAIVREIHEETGIAVEVGALLGIHPQRATAETITGIVLAYACTVATGAAADARAGDDALECRWFATDDLPADIAFDSTHELLARRYNPAR